jgi:hypothetical protein
LAILFLLFDSRRRLHWQFSPLFKKRQNSKTNSKHFLGFLFLDLPLVSAKNRVSLRVLQLAQEHDHRALRRRGKMPGAEA